MKMFSQDVGLSHTELERQLTLERERFFIATRSAARAVVREIQNRPALGLAFVFAITLLARRRRSSRVNRASDMRSATGTRPVLHALDRLSA